MTLRDDNAAIPFVTGHHDQIAEQLQPLRRDSKIYVAIRGEFGDLGRCALVHVQGHIGILLAKVANDFRERVTSLGMGGCNGQAALLLIAVFLGNLFDRFDFAQDRTGYFDDGFTHGGNVGQVFTAASKNLHT